MTEVGLTWKITHVPNTLDMYDPMLICYLVSITQVLNDT
jgi:hypothetical protein